MAKRIAKNTVAAWDGDELIIHWYGMDCTGDDPAAYWRGDERPALIFHGMARSKAWPMAQKPSAEEALNLIVDWQNHG